jgi:uncharacterized membrane-anchored protein YhcB (DUF1043 family)
MGISVAAFVLSIIFMVVLGPLVVIFGYLLLRRRNINKREIQDIQNEISRIREDIADIKEQIADFIIKTH